MRLTDDDLREVLKRAEEIERTGEPAEVADTDVQAIISAATEAGYGRAAVERAISERFDLVTPVVGARVFAKANERYYVADIVSVDAGGVRVKFVKGGEHVVATSDIRRCALVPGAEVSCDWPWWGPWRCSLVTYDERSGYLKLSDRWGSTTICHLGDIWIEPEKKLAKRQMGKGRVVALLSAGAGIGALIGSVITALVL
jgi:hypothetical protein